MIDLSPFRWPALAGAIVAIALVSALPVTGTAEGAAWGRAVLAVPVGV